MLENKHSTAAFRITFICVLLVIDKFDCEEGLLTSYHLVDCLHRTDHHDSKSKRDTGVSRKHQSPAPAAQLDVAKGWENVGQSTSARGAYQLKYGSEVAGYERHGHCGDDKRRGEEDMAVWIPGLVWKPVVHHHFAADEAFEG